MVRVLIAVVLFLVVILGATLKYELDHPCLEYGPERLQYIQKVGSTYVPIYGKDCLRRTP